MAVRTVSIQKTGEGYTIVDEGSVSGAEPRAHAGEQPPAGKEAGPTHRAHDRSDAADWLKEQGAAAEEVNRVLDEAESGEPVYLELSADWSEAENFPRR